MNAHHFWNGVEMRTVMASADPDAPARAITLPADWDDEAAAALAEIVTGTGAVSLPRESARWIDSFTSGAHRPDEQQQEPSRGEIISGRSLAWLLILRQAAPTLAVWHGASDRRPGFVLNLAAFVLPGEDFAAETFVAALRLLCLVLRTDARLKAARRNGELPLDEAMPPEPTLFDLPTMPSEEKSGVKPATPSAPADPEMTGSLLPDAPLPIVGEILLTNLDACLAALGLDYDSDDGRDAACSIVALTTLVSREGTGCDHLPLMPHRHVLPGLSAAIRDAWSRAAVDTETPEARIETGFSSTGPVDALLGCEACGLAPIFSPLRSDGRLAASTLNRLAARGLSVETALAASLAGESPLIIPTIDAHMRMYRALAGFVDRVPARPDPTMAPPPRILPRGMLQPLPERHTGIAQKASVGGHRFFLRTAEYEDGTLGEIALTPARESAMVRGLMESFSQAVSIGLQYGAPLEDFVERFAYSSFGPAGTVEGDPVTSYATSILDYAFRALSNLYLQQRLPDAPHEDDNQGNSPLLPFDFKSGDTPKPSTPGGRRGLRLVS
ncbi:vitamin B12-dependent ribonucleotide reductase [Acetobacter sicerae]|uniref:ribonucleoside-diphosphate reductase n=1 Tax=Acetobacter sicerae TaxID=85325 RepID=A0ABS8VWV1_9PROT|nr:vitamin B12-dependent ribonucleotide reductase [Acetobacter sicerae]MCE0745200.1 vitamin B12-dependent ribonucleotide reductase [Acetobacter sicerae]NHN93689.1 vitamin B12-dependent ribonucleotide reductase [Acetobacter sicerae]